MFYSTQRDFCTVFVDEISVNRDGKVFAGHMQVFNLATAGFFLSVPVT